MEKRTNQEYTVMDSIQVGSIEYVLAERPTHLDRYVVWECLHGTEYHTGHYTSSLGEAQANMLERAKKELEHQRDMGKIPPAFVQMQDFEKQPLPGLYMRPMWPEEQKYVFPQSSQISGQCGSIGRLRGDFDSTGGMFYTSWDEHRASLATSDFKAELDTVVNALRQDDGFGHILKNRDAMQAYCRTQPDSVLAANLADGYGFRIDTMDTAYLLRCKPASGEYDFYLYAYKADWLNQHMENASFGIKFINSSYKELFRIKDGESICVTHSDGEKTTSPCRYIDPAHVEIGRNLYHICEFAERMEQNGSTYAPEEKPGRDSGDKSARPKKAKTQMER